MRYLHLRLLAGCHSPPAQHQALVLSRYDIITNPVDDEILNILTKEEPDILTNEVIIAYIRTVKADDEQGTKPMLMTKHPQSAELKISLKHCSVIDGILYNNNQFEVSDNDLITEDIPNIQHKRKLAGHPGGENTLSLVFCSFTWPLMTEFFFCQSSINLQRWANFFHVGR